MTNYLTNEEAYYLVSKGKAYALETSLKNIYKYELIPKWKGEERPCGKPIIYNYSIDTREVIYFKKDYYVRDRNMDYIRMENNKAYGKDGSIREVYIENGISIF